jgi:hypothetical protein
MGDRNCRKRPVSTRPLGSYVWRRGDPVTATDSRICGSSASTLHTVLEDAVPRHATRNPAMEVAAIVLFSSVVLWFVEEAADEHI